MGWIGVKDVGRGLAMALLVGAPLAAQQQRTHVGGSVHRIDGAVDVIVVSAGEDGLLMVDTGYPFAVEGVRRELRSLSGKEAPDLLVNTHHHHAFSNHLYAGEGTSIRAHAVAAEIMAGTTLMAGQVLDPFPEAGRPHETFTESRTFRFNGEDVSVIPLPGAHTGGDAAIWFRGSGVLATGDVYVPHQPWISVDGGANVGALLSALDQLLAVVPGDVVVVPGHDETSTMADVRAFRDMVSAAADTVGARIGRGLSLRAIQSLGLPDPLAGWEGDAVPQELFLESLYRSLVPVRAYPSAPTIAFENGRWHGWGRFEERSVMYSVDGVLTRSRPARIDRVVDLEGGWVVPPFGEAHTHRTGDPSRLEDDLADFTAAGVFYAMVQDPSAEVTPGQWALARDPGTPDVAYTQGVVTPSWGVIPGMYAMFAAMGRFGDGVTLEDLDGRVLFRLDSPGEVAARWPEIEALNPRFLKVIVAFADEVEPRLADPARYGADAPGHSALPGVTPAVLAALIERAHAAGLEVSAHVETAADFELAVSAGADWIAHMPASWQIGEGTGYGDELEPWLLTEDQAFAARRAFVPVVTTLSPWTADDPRAELFRTVHRRNLQVLKEMGATVAIGSDQFAGSVIDEVLYLRGLGVFSDAQLLELLAVQTPRLIFPGRRIGYLREGYEASFLVLEGDPTADLERIRDIRLRVKNGAILDDPAPAP